MQLIPWRRKRENGAELLPADHRLAEIGGRFDALFDQFLRQPFGPGAFESLLGERGEFPRTDLADAENNVTITMELPGVEPDEVDISISGDVLTVKGEKKSEREQSKRNYHYVERRFGGFQRSLRLPAAADPDKVEAAFKHGVLTITIGKRPEARARTIEVRSE